MCICVFIYMLIFCKLDHFHVCTCHLLHVYCSCFSYNHLKKIFNLLLPFWGRKDLSYWVKLLTFPAHVSVQSFIAEEENGGHTYQYT